MVDRESAPPPAPGERVTRQEVVEREPAGRAPPPTTPMWIWVLPLVLVVIALVWFIFTRGEPRSPLSGPEGIRVPTPEVTVPRPEVQVPSVEIRTPAGGAADADGGAPAAPSPEPAPAAPPPGS